MARPGFFTPLTFKEPRSWENSLLEVVDSYFFVGGQRAVILAGRTPKGKEQAILTEMQSAKWPTVKAISYLILPIFLLMLATKAILRFRHTIKLIDPEKELKKGIEADTAMVKLYTLFHSIRNYENHEELDWISKRDTLVFKIKGHANFVFKMVHPSLWGGREFFKTRYQNMVWGKAICIRENFKHIGVPQARLVEYELDGYRAPLLIEECFDVEREEGRQEESYLNCGAQLAEASQELARFIACTDFNDITWGHIPLINESAGFQGQRRVALVNLSQMGSAEEGFQQLLHCLPPQTLDETIQTIAQIRPEIPIEALLFGKAERLEGLKEQTELEKFYSSKGIVSGREPLRVDITSLGLNLEEKGTRTQFSFDSGKLEETEVLTYTMGQAVEEVIKEINRQLAQASPKDTLKGARLIYIDTQTNPMMTYSELPFQWFPPRNKIPRVWLFRIVQALIDRKYLFKLKHVDFSGYTFQA